MSDSSRRTHYSQKRTRRPKGGTDVYGEREDQGAFVKCGYCGFINKVDRTASGGDTATSGVTPENFAPTVYDTFFPLTIDFQGYDYVLPKSDQAGSAVVVRSNFKPVVNKFCAFCGSPNWNK